MNTRGAAEDGLVTAAGRDARAGQRFGHVTGRQPPASGPSSDQRTYLVRDEETGVAYSFGYADIVTEGLRTLRTGERVRFLIDHGHSGHASYVIRLDLPDIGEYYKSPGCQHAPPPCPRHPLLRHAPMIIPAPPERN